MSMEFRAQIRQLEMSTTTSGSCDEWRRRWCFEALQISTTIFLSLFLPLSFLLLVRLSAALHVSAGGAYDDFVAFIFLYVNSAVLYFLLSFLAVAAFLGGVTGGRVMLVHLLLCQLPASADAAEEVDNRGNRRRRPRFSLVWLLLCASVLFAELGIEFLLAGDEQPSPEYHRSNLFAIGEGLLFAVGLYETMLYWSESVVEPVVEDVVAVVVGMAGKTREKRIRAVEKVGLGLSFGVLWWWRLRDNVDSLAVVSAAADIHRDLVMKVAGSVSLGLYYLTLSTGAVRAFAGVTGTLQQLVARRRRRRSSKLTLRAAHAAATIEENV